MSDELNFSALTLDDVKIPGQEEPTAEPISEPAPAAEPAPAEPAPAEPAPEPAPAAPVEPISVSEPARENPYKFIEEDEFLKGVIEYYQKTKDLTPYLQAKTIDFNQMSDEEVMRRNLREQYPDVSEKAFERLYKQQVVDKFKLDADEFGEEDYELGRELLKTEASKVRQGYLEWQKNFTAPEPKVDDAAKQEEVKLQEALKQFEQSVKSHEATKSILEGKRITVKDGSGEFNFEIQQPETLVDMTLDNNKFFSQFTNAEGQLDYGKWYRVAAYSQNPEVFEKSLINYGKTIGREEIAKEIKNPSPTKVGDIPTEYEGDFTSGLLRAFAEKGVSK